MVPEHRYGLCESHRDHKMPEREVLSFFFLASFLARFLLWLLLSFLFSMASALLKPLAFALLTLNKSGG